MHRRRNTLAKVLPSLQTVDIIGIKIAAVPLTIHPAVVVVTDRLAATVKRKHVAMSARKRTVDHGNIQTRSGQEQKRPTRASSTTAQIDALTIALRNDSSNTSSSARKEVTKIQRQRRITPLKA